MIEGIITIIFLLFCIVEFNFNYFFFVYFSPTGAALQTLGQIKEYLLTPGACHCTLPCRLLPELFFDFDTQVRFFGFFFRKKFFSNEPK